MPKLAIVFRSNNIEIENTGDLINSIKNGLYEKCGLIPSDADEWKADLVRYNYAEFINETYDRYFDVIILNGVTTILACVFEKRVRCLAYRVYVPADDIIRTYGNAAMVEYLLAYGNLFPPKNCVSLKECGRIQHISNDGYFIYKDGDYYSLFESC